MENKVNKFSVVSKIYAQFTEENKETLIKIAKKLLKQQNENTALIADVPKASKKRQRKGATL